MKKNIIAILLLMIVSHVYSQKKPDVVSLFKKVVNKVDETFKKTPVVLSSQNYPSSTSGNIYYRFQFEEIDLNYDVQSTTSLVSPYTGYILLKVQVKSNTKSGDVKGYETIVGFADSVDAMQNNDFESCAESNYDMNQWCVGDIKINYAYQNDKWIFKNVEAETKNKIQYGTVRGDIERGAINNLFKN